MFLRQTLRQHLNEWKNDLPGEWRRVLRDVEIDLDSIPANLELPDEVPVFPGRRDQEIADAPEGAHICRAFEGTIPSQVRVVVLGQDPYPDVRAATGRAFEDGTADNFERALRPALCALGQSAIELHPEADRRAFCHGRHGRAAAIREEFDRLSREGVLFMNAAWTFTRAEDKRHHVALWKDATSRVLRFLHARRDRNLVFLLLGQDARRTVDDLQLAGAQGFRQVSHYHPTARNGLYFRDPNPLQCVNEELNLLEEEQITW